MFCRENKSGMRLERGLWDAQGQNGGVKQIYRGKPVVFLLTIFPN